MKLKNNLFGIAAMALCLGLASCSDDELPYSEATLTNAQLKTILEKQGIQFDKTGHMLLDDKVQNLTKLDLTGTKFTDFKALTILPSLNELDLSDNEFGPTFDFSVLPTQITGVDLTGNDIYDFEGLVDAKVENDELQTTIQHKLVKLHLPETAKWNVEDLMPFYTQSKVEGTTLDMQMEEKGALKPYTTLREIPDAVFLKYIKSVVGENLFEGNKLNIAKPMDAAHEGAMLGFDSWEPFHAELTSFEGIEYFVNNPYYKTFAISIEGKEGFSVDYLMPGANIKCLGLPSVDTKKGINLSKATGLGILLLSNNPSIKSIDLSNTQVCNFSIEKFEMFKSSNLMLTNCNNLEEVVLPKAKGEKAISNFFQIINAPKLKSLDLSHMEGFFEIALINLNSCSIKYPTNLKYEVDANHKKLNPISTEDQVSLGISEDVFALQSTKDFTTKYNEQLMDVWYNYMDYENVTMWQ